MSEDRTEQQVYGRDRQAEREADQRAEYDRLNAEWLARQVSS